MNYNITSFGNKITKKISVTDDDITDIDNYSLVTLKYNSKIPFVMKRCRKKVYQYITRTFSNNYVYSTVFISDFSQARILNIKGDDLDEKTLLLKIKNEMKKHKDRPQGFIVQERERELTKYIVNNYSNTENINPEILAKKDWNIEQIYNYLTNDDRRFRDIDIDDINSDELITWMDIIRQADAEKWALFFPTNTPNDIKNISKKMIERIEYYHGREIGFDIGEERSEQNRHQEGRLIQMARNIDAWWGSLGDGNWKNLIWRFIVWLWSSATWSFTPIQYLWDQMDFGAIFPENIYEQRSNEDIPLLGLRMSDETIPKIKMTELFDYKMDVLYYNLKTDPNFNNEDWDRIRLEVIRDLVTNNADFKILDNNNSKFKVFKNGIKNFIEFSKGKRPCGNGVIPKIDLSYINLNITIISEEETKLIIDLKFNNIIDALSNIQVGNEITIFNLSFLDHTKFMVKYIAENMHLQIETIDFIKQNDKKYNNFDINNHEKKIKIKGDPYK